MLVRIYVTYIVQLVLIPDHSVIGDVILSVSQARDTIVLSSFFTYGCQTNNIPLNSTAAFQKYCLTQQTETNK